MASIIKVDTIQTAAGGTPTAADLGINTTGSVLQVVQGTLTTANSASLASAATTDTGLSASITPSSTSSKILCLVKLECGGGGNVGPFVQLYRGTTLVGAGDANGSRSRAGAAAPKTVASYEDTSSAVINHLDSPNTTSAVTYKVQIGNARASTDNVMWNRGFFYDNRADVSTRASSIILMEIAG